MQPLISIALCTYNGASFLEEQILSIVNQTYKNIEIIIVDDCSTDGTLEITNQLAKKHPQIKSFQNKKNLGFNTNFQKAIELTKGDYIAISDQDDIWELNKLEILLNHIGTNWLIFSNSTFIDENNNSLNKTLLHPSFNLGERDFRSLLFYNFVTGHTTLFSNKLIPYLLPIPVLSYYDWWMGFIALYHKKITYLNKNLTKHRIHKSSVMQQEVISSFNNQKKARSQEILNNLKVLKDYKNLSLNDKELILNLFNGYKKEKLFNFFLIKELTQNYKYYFPNLKNRNWISRFNFALKLSRRY